MGTFERFLSIWVFAAIVIGVVAGLLAPGFFELLAGIEFAHVNLVIAVFVWFMIYPMMLQIDFTSLKNISKKPKGIFLTLVVNWLIKPFTMAGLGILFFHYVFAGFVDSQSANEYIAGMILLGVAPCTAMVFVWSQLTKGDANYTLLQVSVNDVIMVFAFAPIAAFLLGVSNITVPWNTLLLSVALYVVLPLLAALATRKLVKEINPMVEALKPLSISALLATIVLLFALQATTIIQEPLAILLIAVPLLIQSYLIFFIAYFAAKHLRLQHEVAAPAALIGTSNFFELAVAVAISLFGLHSGAALATVVGVLVEVPVMLSLVKFSNSTRHWFTTNS